MLNIIVVALIAMFVSVIATAYYYEYKIAKKANANRVSLPTALDRAYEKGYDAGYKQGGTDNRTADRILNRPKG
jgi:hypothetical protein